MSVEVRISVGILTLNFVEGNTDVLDNGIAINEEDIALFVWFKTHGLDIDLYCIPCDTSGIVDDKHPGPSHHDEAIDDRNEVHVSVLVSV